MRWGEMGWGLRGIALVASGGGAGFLPVAPGTWGSLVGLAVHWALVVGLRPSFAVYLLILAAVTGVGVWSAGAMEKILDRADPGLVVVDEIAGMLVTLAGVEPGVVTYVAAFLAFRFFDIVKPFPVGWLDRRLHGGMGIMADDLAAGVYSLVTVRLLLWGLGTG